MDGNDVDGGHEDVDFDSLFCVLLSSPDFEIPDNYPLYKHATCNGESFSLGYVKSPSWKADQPQQTESVWQKRGKQATISSRQAKLIRDSSNMSESETSSVR